MYTAKQVSAFEVKGKTVKLVCQNIRGLGEVVDVQEDRFVFRQIVNEYECFSNISDPPVYEDHVIMIADVLSMERYGVW